VIHEDIEGLNVSVDDTIIVQILYGTQQLMGHIPDLLLLIKLVLNLSPFYYLYHDTLT